MATGVILLAHGSRDPLWRKPVEAVAARMQALQPEVPVRCAYLELTTPDLPSATAELAGLGITALRVVPLFLGVGKHAREDLPRLVESLKSLHPGIAFALQPPVGEDGRLIDLLATMALESNP